MTPFFRIETTYIKNHRLFPKNEIAQSEIANNGTFANYWIHNGLMMVGKEKMSKSLMNDTSIQSWLKIFHPEVIRYLIISNHYRSHIQFIPERYTAANKNIYQIYKTLRDFDISTKKISQPEMEKLINQFEKHMDNDFNTVEVIAMVHGLVRKINTHSIKDTTLLATYISFIKKIGKIIGLFDLDPKKTLEEIENRELDRRKINREYVQHILQSIDEYRHNKDYIKSDVLREELIKQGIAIINKGTSSSWEIIFE